MNRKTIIIDEGEEYTYEKYDSYDESFMYAPVPNDERYLNEQGIVTKLTIHFKRNTVIVKCPVCEKIVTLEQDGFINGDELDLSSDFYQYVGICDKCGVEMIFEKEVDNHEKI